MYKQFFITIMMVVISACSTIPDTKVNNLLVSSPLVSVLDSSGFSAFKDVLRDIVNDRAPGVDKPQHFYVAHYSGDQNITYMFWLEKKLLWIMSPGSADEESWLSVRYPSGGQLIDMKEGVVATAESVGGSSYLVTQEWAENKLFDSLINGDLIIIE